jgi:DNA invertase Pin-like site-specific DNA recombinase
MKIPKYIIKKINRLDKLLDEATELKHEIENWAESKGCDTVSSEWYNDVMDESSGCNGISLAGLQDYIEDIKEGGG